MDQLRCIACDKTHENYMEGRGVQPALGLAFLTRGHYGSTYFDPMDGSSIEIVVCDECLKAADQRGLVYRTPDY